MESSFDYVKICCDVGYVVIIHENTSSSGPHVRRWPHNLHTWLVFKFSPRS
jgi:hypothetical protein